MKCPKCNQEIDDDSVFCDYCGAKIEQARSAQPQGETHIEDRVAEMVRKTVGGVANTCREGKSKVETNFPVIKERIMNVIKKITDYVVNKCREIINKVKTLKYRKI